MFCISCLAFQFEPSLWWWLSVKLLSALSTTFHSQHCSTNIKSNNTNEGDVLEIIWGGWRCADEILRDLVGDGRFQGEGRDKQRLILSDRQRRAALVWQRSCSFNASDTWRQSPASLSITAETQRDTCLTWLKRVVEFYSQIWVFGCLFFFCFSPSTQLFEKASKDLKWDHTVCGITVFKCQCWLVCAKGTLWICLPYFVEVGPPCCPCALLMIVAD